MENKILELETRREIFNCIERYPGLHTRRISRQMELPFSTLRYHLRFLKKRGLIKEKKDGRYSRYYTSYKIGRNEKQVLNSLRQKTPGFIILFLFNKIYASQAEISRALQKHPTTIKFHLNKLLTLGIIEQVETVNNTIRKDNVPTVIEHNKKVNEVIYMLKDPYWVYDLLITYKDSFFDSDAIAPSLDFFSCMISDGIPKKIISPRSSIDAVLDAVKKLFPPPFRV
jgi:predicted transcriptional regulator